MNNHSLLNGTAKLVLVLGSIAAVIGILLLLVAVADYGSHESEILFQVGAILIASGLGNILLAGIALVMLDILPTVESLERPSSAPLPLRAVTGP